MPDRAYTQFNGYKKNYYPVLTLMVALHKRGELTAEQEAFMAPRRPNEEFYDLENDPHELHNLAKSSEHQEILTKMREELNRWIKDTGDMGQIPEARDTVAREQARMQKKHEATMKKRGLSARISDENYLKWWEEKLLAIEQEKTE